MITARFMLYLINVVLSLVEFLIAIRIFLRFFGAAATAPFVQWVYTTTQPLLAPFNGMFPSPAIQGGFVIEFSALFALLVYAFLGFLITELVNELVFHSNRRVQKK